MTLTIELTPEEEQRVHAAQAIGVDVQAAIHNTLAALPMAPDEAERLRHIERVRAGRGKFAHLGPSVDALLAERQYEREAEARRLNLPQEPAA